MTRYCQRATAAAILCSCAMLAAAGVSAQAMRSPAVAREVAALMTARQFDAFAAQDPETPNRFVATLLIPNVQMLVVAAEYPVPGELQAQLGQKNYRDVYTALHQPVAAGSRFFLIDLGCDGLGATGDAVDVLYEKGTTQTLFNGDWKKQGLSEAAYNQRMQDADAQYTRLLTLLRDGLKGSASGAQVP